MKLSTKGRYGLRAAVDLAIFAKVSRSQSALLPPEKAYPSYQLAKPAGDISVGDVLRALEGDMVVVDCPDSESKCAKFDSCVTKYVWKRINNSINDTMDSMTLEEIAANSPGITEENGQKAYCSK